MSRIIEALTDQWIYDIETLSQGWMIWTVFPALFYVAFMMVKWLTLTCPVWLPAIAIIRSFKSE